MVRTSFAEKKQKKWKKKIIRRGDIINVLVVLINVCRLLISFCKVGALQGVF
jgi:hypothetical protein